ncbi:MULTISPECIES: ectoine synthase [Streptomyces]|jgi:L-ectoine synthase|uniref:L-ectoine synthase n=1 Tax=Streptomyces albidoflavus TaxID=1886 RepID=A0ABY3GZK6_9ACTN|nr:MULTISPECIES: ectoine synthase [Streptomyces]MYQ73808.1 L-ectoine synthase [Streptomyces sp. SID4934]PKA38669.1 ectoine synthase [Streptomyces sp. SM8]RZF09700.1 ectoine synthase [Streptomyces albidoflavus]TWV25675.1 ectoine synthase [Streptomyces albidoflavus]SCE31582.1 L-ectoine synthase [Streptomyces sp. ScaeMP-6W]
MIIRKHDDVSSVDWGNGTSRRFLTASDGLGYTVTDTVVRAGTKSRLEYRRHLEACYCIGGSGEVVDTAGDSHPITPGTLYALDKHDAHWLVASPHEDLRLVCVFTPALRGDEVHNLDAPEFSQY